MFTKNNPDIDPEALGDYVRRRANVDAAEPDRAPEQGPDARTCRLDELIVESPALCVRNGYRTLLGRDPTPAEQRRHQVRIEQGASRLLFVLRLRYGREGRAAGVRLTGLRQRLAVGLDTRLRRYRWVARCLNGLRDLGRIPRMPSDLARLQRDYRALDDQCNRLAARLDRYEAAGCPREPTDATEARTREGAAEATAALDAIPDGDRLYVAFENRFRSSEGCVRERQRPCLEALTAATVGTPDRPVLDLGCGRGEWLELLVEAGLEGRGVDASPEMVATARGRGYRVEQGDAIATLAACAPASLGAVTAFHLVEHLPFERLLALLDHALAALVPSGLLLLETPNPENLDVGANSFWLDPTHRRPLPPPLLAFLAEERGFSGVRTVACHPVDDAERSQPATAFEAAVETRLFGPRDYRVLAYRPA